MPVLKNQDILFLSSDDWGWKTSKYHLSKRFAESNRVIFASSIGFRSPTVSREHFGRIVAKLRAFVKGAVQVSEGPYVVTPMVIPFIGFPFRTTLNQFLLRLQLRWNFRTLKFSPKYVFVFSQNWHPFLSMFNAKIIYYCVDDQAAFDEIDVASFQDLDRKLSAGADVIFCSSRVLYETKKKDFPHVCYSPHGVEFDRFQSAVADAQLVEPGDIANLPSPRLLFFGHLSYDWVDTALVKFIAEQKPKWQILLIGRCSLRADEFRNHPNVHLLGERQFEELPAYCAYSQLGLIPFVDSELTRSCNPLKLYEYLSAGLPVVSTNIPEVRSLDNEFVRVSDSYAGFVSACDELLIGVSSERAGVISASMSEHSWDSRVADIGAIVDAL